MENTTDTEKLLLHTLSSFLGSLSLQEMGYVAVMQVYET